MDAARSPLKGPPGGLECLMGDEALEPVFIAPGRRGTSKKLPGWSDPLVCIDRLDELLDVFLRSWWPVLNCTSRGDDGWDTRLGEQVGCCVYRSGDAGLFDPLFADSALLSGIGRTGLESSDGVGELTTGDMLGRGLF
jgi:hypothetical protein